MIFTSYTWISASPLTTSNSWVIHTWHSTKEGKPVSAVLTMFPFRYNSSHFYQYSNKAFANGLEWKLYQVYMCRYGDGLTCWEKKNQNQSLKQSTETIENKHCTHPLLLIHKSQVQYPLKKIAPQRNPKEAEFFSVWFSKIMWACVGNHRLEFFNFFFFHKARGLCSRRIDGVKNEEMFQKWDILSSFILIWHTYYKIKIFKSAICFVSLIAICKARFYTCCLRHNVSGSVSGRLDTLSLSFPSLSGTTSFITHKELTNQPTPLYTSSRIT